MMTLENIFVCNFCEISPDFFFVQANKQSKASVNILEFIGIITRIITFLVGFFYVFQGSICSSVTLSCLG